ncbi:MAG: acyl--CoA ligase [Ignavibacteriales bacterium]|nr:acyl--CoA ligase [Ignavibacteriales bacterium]
MINIALNSNWLKEQSKESKDVIAIKTSTEEITYSELEFFVDSSTKFFSDKVRPYKYFLVSLENSIEFVLTILSLWNIGIIPVITAPDLKTNELEEILKPFRRNIKITSKDEILHTIKKAQNLSKQEIKRKYDNKIYKNKNAIVLFTSGTVGIPKAVLISFENLFYSAIGIDSIINTQKKDLWFASLPFCHVGGFSIITRSLLSGSTLCIPESLKTEHLFSSIQKFDPNYISLVPTQITNILEKDVLPNKNLKRIFIGGSKLNSNLANKLIEIKLPTTIVYGSTETCSMITAISDNEILNHPDSVGKPLLNTEIKFLDSNGNEVKPNKEGLLFLNGPTIAVGYLQKKLQNFDGKHLTKDFGYKDNENYIYIVGRSDGIIISGGKKIDPSEIEKLLLENININDCAVVGVEDNIWGEKVVALVVKKQKSTITQNEIFKFLRTKLPGYKIPKKIIFVETIPRNYLGKKDIKAILSLI